MLTFVIGARGRGKSTFAAKLASSTGQPVVSGGAWIREALGETGHGPEAAERLRAASIEALRADPLHAARWIEAAVGQDRDAIVEGLRNPTDLLYLARPGDHVLDLGGEGDPGWERDGLAAIRACRPHLARLGVTWADHHRHFATLPVPISASVPLALLHGDDRPGLDQGRILALESYPGHRVTVCWISQAGGTFHDIPLGRIVLSAPSEAVGEAALPDGDPCYSRAGRGPLVVELPPQQGPVVVFDRERRRVGVGRSLWMAHWPEDNVLLHLVAVGDRLILWPPHKLLWDPDATALPGWRKLEQPADPEA